MTATNDLDQTKDLRRRARESRGAFERSTRTSRPAPRARRRAPSSEGGDYRLPARAPSRSTRSSSSMAVAQAGGLGRLGRGAGGAGAEQAFALSRGRPYADVAGSPPWTSRLVGWTSCAGAVEDRGRGRAALGRDADLAARARGVDRGVPAPQALPRPAHSRPVSLRPAIRCAAAYQKTRGFLTDELGLDPPLSFGSSSSLDPGPGPGAPPRYRDSSAHGGVTDERPGRLDDAVGAARRIDVRAPWPPRPDRAAPSRQPVGGSSTSRRRHRRRLRRRGRPVSARTRPSRARTHRLARDQPAAVSDRIDAARSSSGTTMLRPRDRPPHPLLAAAHGSQTLLLRGRPRRVVGPVRAGRRGRSGSTATEGSGRP